MENSAGTRLIDLSHTVEDGMVTYKGLPGPHICDFWSREQSAANYDDGSRFQIGKIEMIANTGTYVDAPFHRFEDGKDLSELALESLANLDGIVIRRPFEAGLAIDADSLDGVEAAGKAVLFATGWNRHWQTEDYFTDHPFLTAAAAQRLAIEGAAFVGIDSHNIDYTRVRSRPVHTTLLRAGVPIGEHLTNLGALPDGGFCFSAVPPKIKGMGTFAVRAYAVVGV